MPFPKNRSELLQQGYKFQRSGVCGSPYCMAEIEWWVTPKQALIPLNKGTYEPHWATCTVANTFRKKGK